MSVWFKSRLNPWYIWIPSNPNLYSTQIKYENAMANNCKQCFNTHYQPHCHPTTKSLWLCSSVYCGSPHPSRRIMVGGRSRQPTIEHLFYTTLSFVYHFKAMGEFKLQLQSGNTHSGRQNQPHWTISCHSSQARWTSSFEQNTKQSNFLKLRIFHTPDTISESWKLLWREYVISHM